jgi:hypothetical protein
MDSVFSLWERRILAALLGIVGRIITDGERLGAVCCDSKIAGRRLWRPNKWDMTIIKSRSTCLGLWSISLQRLCK